MMTVRASMLAGATALGLMSAAAQADISWIVFKIDVQTPGEQSGSVLVDQTVGDYDPVAGTYAWSSGDGGGNDIFVYDDFTGEVIATFSADIFYVDGGGAPPAAGAGTPSVDLNFAVQAMNMETQFTITSALISFPTIDPAEGRASAGITVTDINGDGASLVGDSANGAYTAFYNSPDMSPGGTIFTELVPEVTAGTFSSDSESDAFPGGGLFSPIGVGVDNISSQFSFTLSALDLASGTSIFEVIPAPATLSLLAGGLLLAPRRRRRTA